MAGLNNRFSLNNPSTSDEPQYRTPDAFLNINVEDDEGNQKPLNFYETRGGKLKDIGIKLYNDIPIHAALIQILSADPDKAQNLAARLRISFGMSKPVDDTKPQLTL